MNGRGSNARAWPPLVTPSFCRALVAPTPLSASWQLRLSASPRLTSQCAPPAFAAFSPLLQRCRCWLPPLPAEGGGGGVATAPVAPPPVRPLFFGWRGSLSSRHQQRRCHPRRCYLCWRLCCRRPVSSPPTTPVHTPKSWRLEGPHIPRWSWHGARRGGCAAGGWGCGSVGTNTVKEVSLLVFSGEVRF